jgi:hypothetical protein
MAFYPDLGATVMTFEAFDEEQWEAVRSVREDWPEDMDWKKFRGDLEAEGQLYWSLHDARNEFGIPSKVRNRLEALLGHYGKLQRELSTLPRLIKHDLPDIRPLGSWLQDMLNLYTDEAQLDRQFFPGKSDYYRHVLQQRLLHEWVNRGGGLSFSRDRYGNPYGPAIDFLSITLKAILGKAPGSSGLAKIIEDYRQLPSNRLPEASSRKNIDSEI